MQPIHPMEKSVDLVVIGGGAAGFFGALRAAELQPHAKIIILEKSSRVLDKVRISGGGRCNVTHGCFDPAELVRYYPRGQRELLGPFHRFLCGDMMAWLDERGVETKIEDDGRVFPVSDQSESITNCFENEARRLNIEVITRCGVTDLQPVNNRWQITTPGDRYTSPKVLVTSGSSPAFWQLLSQLGVQMVSPVPSLFTFNSKHPLLKNLMGLSVPSANLRIEGSRLEASGPLLITHWGVSGPAVLRLSAWGAREFAQRDYRFTLIADFTGETNVNNWVHERRTADGKKKVINTPFPNISKRLWERMLEIAEVGDLNWGDLQKSVIEALVLVLSACRLDVNGKSTFKDEFVTAGGVELSEINFKTMEHQRLRGLHFAGEVLNIDAITGGFNFQAAWTTSYIAAEACVAAH